MTRTEAGKDTGLSTAGLANEDGEVGVGLLDARVVLCDEISVVGLNMNK